MKHVSFVIGIICSLFIAHNLSASDRVSLDSRAGILRAANALKTQVQQEYYLQSPRDTTIEQVRRDIYIGAQEIERNATKLYMLLSISREPIQSARPYFLRMKTGHAAIKERLKTLHRSAFSDDVRFALDEVETQLQTLAPYFH